jgi:hypothetical protein
MREAPGRAAETRREQTSHRPPVVEPSRHRDGRFSEDAVAAEIAAPGILDAIDLLALQRLAGNRAVARLIRSREAFQAPPSARGQHLLQRNGAGAQQLKKLVVPQPFPGPEFEAQGRIATALDEEIEALDGWAKGLYGISCVGGIELTDPGLGKLDDLIKGARLIDLPQGVRSVGKSSFAMAEKRGVERDVIRNTLTTMEVAGQLEYLRTSGLIDAEWTILIEVHYYRSREVTSTRTHKDTLGQTLFVNLNFMNDDEIAGPEVLINPFVPGEHKSARDAKLPKAFTGDLDAALSGFDEGDTYLATRVPAKGGVIPFVDEALHHKTPTLAHRQASLARIRTALERKYGLAAGSLVKAHADYTGRNWFWRNSSFASYLKSPRVDEAEGQLIHGLLEALATGGKAGYDRNELAKLLPRPDFLDIDALVETGLEDGQGVSDFGTASIPYMKKVLPQELEGRVPTKGPGRPALKRTMSGLIDRDEAPKPAPGKRTFFRTWVRAVPRKAG